MPHASSPKTYLAQLHDSAALLQVDPLFLQLIVEALYSGESPTESTFLQSYFFCLCSRAVSAAGEALAGGNPASKARAESDIAPLTINELQQLSATDLTFFCLCQDDLPGGRAVRRLHTQLLAKAREEMKQNIERLGSINFAEFINKGLAPYLPNLLRCRKWLDDYSAALEADAVTPKHPLLRLLSALKNAFYRLSM